MQSCLTAFEVYFKHMFENKSRHNSIPHRYAQMTSNDDGYGIPKVFNLCLLCQAPSNQW